MFRLEVPGSGRCGAEPEVSAFGLATFDRIGCTEIMRRIGMYVVVPLIAAAGLAAGCGSKEPAAAPPPPPAGSTPASSPASSPSATPSASPSVPVEFTVDGAGPYVLGATLAALQASGSLDQVTTGGDTCPENTTGRGTGTWSDIWVSFREDGKLYLAINRSPSIPSPSGAWLGDTLAELKTVYKLVPGQELTQGNRTAYLVTTLSGRAILFDLGTGKQVISMAAGDGFYLRSSFEGGTDFC